MYSENNLNELIALLEQQLSSPLPGAKVQEIMAPSFRNDYKTDKKKLRQSSVLILIYPKDDIPTFVLMKRSNKLRLHSGQIGLPGGSKDKEDISLYHTAVRETKEELGIEEKHLKLLGSLTPLFIPVSNFMVHPFISYLTKPPIFTPNKSEVAEIIEVPINLLLDNSIITEERWEKLGKLYIRPYFSIENHKIWGATAMILNEFKELLLRN